MKRVSNRKRANRLTILEGTLEFETGSFSTGSACGKMDDGHMF